MASCARWVGGSARVMKFKRQSQLETEKRREIEGNPLPFVGFDMPVLTAPLSIEESRFNVSHNKGTRPKNDHSDLDQTENTDLPSPYFSGAQIARTLGKAASRLDRT